MLETLFPAAFLVSSVLGNILVYDRFGCDLTAHCRILVPVVSTVVVAVANHPLNDAPTSRRFTLALHLPHGTVAIR